MHSLRTGAFAELETALAGHVADLKQQRGPLAPVRVIVPTSLLRLYLRRRLADHVNVRFSTLRELVAECAADTGQLPRFADELIAETILREKVPDGSYFHPVSDGLGFRACLLGVFRDLKEAGISSREFGKLAGKTGLPKGKFTQLAALYRAYDGQLQSRGVADEADLLALAGGRLRLPEASGVCLYGFYDFNFLQRELVRAIARQHPLAAFVPWRDEPAWRFAEPTVAWLERLLAVKRATNPKSTVRNPKFEVISAPGEARECREILRESLSYARAAGCPLHEIGVVARGDEPYGPLLRDMAQPRGWPVHLATGRPALEAVEPRLILLLLEMAATDFRRSAVIEFAGLAPRFSSQAAEWERLSAELGIVGGAGQWRERVAGLLKQLRADAAIADDAQRGAIEWRAGIARGLAAFVESLTEAAGRIPAEGRWPEMTEAVGAAAKALFASDELDAPLAQLRALDDLEPYRPRVRREEFALYARKTFEAAAAPEGAYQAGGPFVGGIMAARGVRWRMVVVPGLVEKGWPRTFREDPILLDDERRAINALLGPGDGLPRLEEKLARGMEEERMLFRLACDAARERLVLTFPRIEPASGRPRVPSVFLLEMLGVSNFTQLDARVRRVPLVPMAPGEGEALDGAEFDYRLLVKLRDGRVAGVTPLLDALSPTLAPGLVLAQGRWGSEGRFGRFNGCLERPESLELLRAIFDLAKHRWAVSRLENYARSPFSFFLSDVLGIRDLEDPEAAESISALDFGELYHQLLSNIVRRFQLGNLLPLDPTRAVESELVLEDEAERVFGEFAARGVTGYPLLWRVKKEKTRADLLRWLRHEYHHAAGGFSPVATEWAFGRAAGPPPARIELDEETTLLVAGQIDRVDRGPEDEYFVMDYKTGKPAGMDNASFCRARALQIPVYMLASEQLTGKPCGGGGYYYATRRGGFVKYGWVREELAAAEPRLREILASLVRSILAGKFFITPDGWKAAGTAMTRAAVETLWELHRDDEELADYRRATEEGENA